MVQCWLMDQQEGEKRMQKRLRRSTEDRMLGGVCGGLAEFFEVDSNLVRLAFLLLALFTGTGVVLYLLLWLILPEEGKEELHRDRWGRIKWELRERARELGEANWWLGVGLVAAGVVLLLRNLGLFSWFQWRLVWPALLILAGGWLLVQRRRGGAG